RDEAYQDDGLRPARVAFQAGVGPRRDLWPLRIIKVSCRPCDQGRAHVSKALFWNRPWAGRYIPMGLSVPGTCSRDPDCSIPIPIVADLDGGGYRGNSSGGLVVLLTISEHGLATIRGGRE